MTFAPTDDRRHTSDVEEGWLETWSFELSRADGLYGAVRLTLAPATRMCAWWTYVVGTEIGIVIVRDEEVGLPKRGDSLEVRGDGLWGDLVCETPFEHWGISLEAFGLRVDESEDETGERIPVGLDLEWEVTDPPEPTKVKGGEAYTQTGVMHGEILIDEDRIDYEGAARREHAWGRIPPPVWPSRLTD